MPRRRRKPYHRDYAEPSGFRPIRSAYVPVPIRTPVRAPRKAPVRKVSTRPNRLPSRYVAPRRRQQLAPMPARRNAGPRRRGLKLLTLNTILKKRTRAELLVDRAQTLRIKRHLLPCRVAVKKRNLIKFIHMRKRLGGSFGSQMKARRYVQEKREAIVNGECV